MHQHSTKANMLEATYWQANGMVDDDGSSKKGPPKAKE
jgi:hypothetical protein